MSGSLADRKGVIRLPGAINASLMTVEARRNRLGLSGTPAGICTPAPVAAWSSDETTTCSSTSAVDGRLVLMVSIPPDTTSGACCVFAANRFLKFLMHACGTSRLDDTSLSYSVRQDVQNSMTGSLRRLGRLSWAAIFLCHRQDRALCSGREVKEFRLALKHDIPVKL